MSLNSISNELQKKDRRQDKVLETAPADVAIDALSKFIPTELLAPFVAALSLTATKAVTWNVNKVYCIFVIITPLAFLLFHFAKIALDEKASWPKGLGAWINLIWKMVASTVAFAVWAIAVPTNGLQANVGGAAVAGFIAICVSPVLTAIDAIVIRLLKELLNYG